MATSCHILVKGSPIIIYASRNGSPHKVLRILGSFLQTFAQERETAGEFPDIGLAGCQPWIEAPGSYESGAFPYHHPPLSSP